MAKHHSVEPTPACYAMVHQGLEEVAGDEITRDLHGEVKKSGRGIVAFRVPEITPEILKLRTTEDIFLLAWGTDELTHRASVDLDKIRNWTKRAPWSQLLKIHHSVHAKPKGKPTYRLVTQMAGTQGYHRHDAGKMLAEGLEGVFPSSWKPANENAAVEVWLTISGTQAVCGLRLSDRTMRHRPYKTEHLPASLRPTLAAAMVRLAGIATNDIVLDPMCGVGTLLAEAAEMVKQRGRGAISIWGGDIERPAIVAATTNLKRNRPEILLQWDARRLPLAGESVDRIVCNPPFGRQLGEPEEIAALYRRVIFEINRVLKPGGRAAFLVGNPTHLLNAVQPAGWIPHKQVRVRILGLSALIAVWRKPNP